MIAWIQANWGIMFAVLFAADQLLAAIPSIKSNSVFQFITNLLGAAAPVTTPPAVQAKTP